MTTPKRDYEPMCEECHLRVVQIDDKCSECWNEAEEEARDIEFESRQALGYSSRV